MRNVMLALALSLAACAAFEEDFRRGVSHYDAERYRESLAVWSVLAGDVVNESRRTQGEYYFYRGMTHLRLGHRGDARHDLVIARQFRVELDERMQGELNEALGRLQP